MYVCSLTDAKQQQKLKRVNGSLSYHLQWVSDHWYNIVNITQCNYHSSCRPETFTIGNINSKCVGWFSFSVKSISVDHNKFIRVRFEVKYSWDRGLECHCV